MPCCTYLSDNEHTTETTDKELNELLAEVRKLTGHDWRMREMVSVRKRLFRKPTTRKYYMLYSHVAAIEFQIINFYRPERKDEVFGSMNFVNDAGYLAAFFYGLLEGVRTARKEPTDAV